MQVLPPFVVYQSDKLTEAEWPAVADTYKRRITGLFNDRPIAFRAQNGGHYDGQQVLKPELGAGESGTGIHLVQSGDPQEVLDSRAPDRTASSETMTRRHEEQELQTRD